MHDGSWLGIKRQISIFLCETKTEILLVLAYSRIVNNAKSQTTKKGQARKKFILLGDAEKYHPNWEIKKVQAT